MMDLSAFFNLSYGMYVVSSCMDGKFNGQIANAVSQVTAEPVTLAVIVNKKNLTHEYIHNSKLFSLSVLSKEAPMSFIGKFGFKSGRDIDKFNGTNYKLGETGVPIVLDYTTACFEFKVEQEIEVYTHTIFVGRAVRSEIIDHAEPMTYEYYHLVKKGLSPENAPTYINNKKIENNNFKEEKKMYKYECSICGYVYDPEVGDPEGGIAPGTAFEDVPDDWVCPVCGAGKSDFVKID